MKLKRKLIALSTCGILIIGNLNFAFADSTRVVTIGVNNSSQQRETILKYFGVNENEVEVIEVNNQEERKYLEGIATEAQIGRKTYSCAYVQPTNNGGINVKTANLTWLTSATVASTLTTAGLKNADVVVASAIPASGTGALTGIMKAFETATGETLDESKKELATEELVITGDLGEDVGQDVATGVVNDIKTEIIKNGTSDTTQIADTITNVTNNYNITLSPEQQEKLANLMLKISQEDYDYNSIKDSLNGVKDIVNDKLKEEGIQINQGFLDSVKDFFDGIGDWFTGLLGENNKDLGILESTDDSILGSNVIIDATDKNAINLPSSEEVEGFFTKIWNWVAGLFDNKSEESNDNVINNNENSNLQIDENLTTESNETLNDDTVEYSDEHIDDNIDNMDKVDMSDSDLQTNNLEDINIEE